ncbi:MAG: antirestriction protein ArdA, partial [Oscillospiraceae bacterium]|nr:antirestriction protein ArdA [Oscillospiraceae bacterium]
MRKVFEVELGSRSELYTKLILPAAPYALLDALEKLRLEDGETPTWATLSVFNCERIADFMDEDGTLFELNALCQQLALLDEGQLAIVEGLAKMEYEQGGQPVPLPRLIDMAYSTDRCHFVEEATDDYTLGRFCAENGFVPEADDLSDEAFELLDFVRIGREFRQNEGGVFTSGGYVQKHDELRQVYETLDLAPKKPDHTLLVQTASGCEVRLPVPLGDPTGDEPVLCLDCAAPALTGLTGTIGTWDMLAHRLAELEVDGELLKYKALVEATGCDDICQALSLADELDQYMLDPKCHTPEEVARGAINMTVPRREIESLLPHVNLYQYGQALIQASG